MNSYNTAHEDKLDFIKRNDLRAAECCYHCYHAKAHRHHSGLVKCGLLVWEVGNDVSRTDTCNAFVRRE
jgi:hypothetical protein